MPAIFATRHLVLLTVLPAACHGKDTCSSFDGTCRTNFDAGSVLLQKAIATSKDFTGDPNHKYSDKDAKHRADKLMEKHPTLEVVENRQRQHLAMLSKRVSVGTSGQMQALQCEDTNTQEGWEEGKVGKDAEGDLCKSYKGLTEWCGFHDDSDFKAKEMCCVCGGGTQYEGPRSLAPGQAKVMVSNPGQECPEGFEAIKTLAACRAGMEIVGQSGMWFEGKENDGNFPSGCYMHDSGIFFNEHLDGTTESESASFCQSGFQLNAGKVVFVGDSDTDYWNTLPYFPNSYNLGVGGYECEHVFQESSWVIDAFMPSKWVSLSCGENDIEGGCANGCTPRKAFGRWKKVVNAFTEKGARILYYSTKRGPDQSESYTKFKKFDDMVKKHVLELAAGEEKPPVVMVNMSGGFDVYSNARSLYQSDGLHQSGKAYDLVIDWAQKAMSSDTSCAIWLNGECQAEAPSDDDY